MNTNENPNEAQASAETTPARRRPRRASRPAGSPDAASAARAEAAAKAEAPAKTEAPAKVEAAPKAAAAPKRTAAPKRAAASKKVSDETGSLDVFAELGGTPTQDSASGQGDLRLDDLVLPEREAGTSAKRAPKKAAPAKADRAPAKAEKPAEPAEEEGRDGSPRLPATALLFQPPQPTTRRAKASRAKAEEESSEDSAKDDHPKSDRPKSDRPKSGQRKPRPKVEDEPDDSETDQDADADPDNDSDDHDGDDRPRRRRRRGGRGRRRSGNGSDEDSQDEDEDSSRDSQRESQRDSQRVSQRDSQRDSGKSADSGDEGSSSHRRRTRTRPADSGQAARDAVTPLRGSTRLEAKRQRRREGRETRRRHTIITEAEFLARRESVDRDMIVRESDGRTQIAVLEDNVLVEHYVAQKAQTSMVGNVFFGRVQNVLPSMEAAFVDIGRGRNAVLYAGEVNWDAAGLEGQPRRIEQALKSGDFVVVQATKDPIDHKGARLTAQVTLAGRYLVLVPSGSMTGISRKLPEAERARLKKLLKDLVPAGQGVIVRTAAEGATEDQLARDIERLTSQWTEIEKKVKRGTTSPVLLKGEPELATRVVRDIFNEDFRSLEISGESAWNTLNEYVTSIAPDLAERMTKWTKNDDIFAAHRIDEQLVKGTDRKVWLPSGGSLVIDRTEAMTVVDVNTGKFTGSGGTLEETVTRNNLEAAEEVVRQLRLRDIGGIIVIDFIDMVLESNRDLILRRLIECLGRDRTRHQVAEVTSLGLVQMTRKRVGQGLVEVFSTPCECCAGRGFIVHSDPVEQAPEPARKKGRSEPEPKQAKARPAKQTAPEPEADVEDEGDREQLKVTLNAIAAAATTAHEEADEAPAKATAKKTPAKAASAKAPAKEPAKKATRKPRQASTAKAELVTVEPVKGELVKTETAQAEPAEAEPAQAAPAKAPRRASRRASAPAGDPATAEAAQEAAQPQE